MDLRSSILAALVAVTAYSSAAQAHNAFFPPVAAASPADALVPGHDPFAPVFIVTSRASYAGFADIATRSRSTNVVRDSMGTELVIAEVQTFRLDEISGRIHRNEQRCGGYFAFATRAEAEAFVRADRSAASAGRALLPAYTIDNQATVNPWLSVAGEPGIRETILHLSSYTNRYYASTYGRTSAEWIRTKWAGLAAGRSDVTTELYTGCTNCSTQPSVILTIQGSDLAGEVVVLGGHLDSINSSAAGSLEQTAPGADDDASGIATLTEVLRVSLASGWKPRRTVKFMGYAAEEVGLRGSNSIAQSFKAAGTNVVGVLQLDMTNYKSGSSEDMQLITDYSNTDLKNYVVALFDAYLAPRGITRGTYTCGYGCSDHASWTTAGYPSAMMFEAGGTGGASFPQIHGPNDTLANLGGTAQNSVKFAQLGLAFLGELGKTAGSTPPVNLPPVANFGSSFNGLSGTFTDSSTDSDGSITARAWNFGDGTTSAATNPGKTYAAAGTYTVTLTVTDNAGATNTKAASVTVTAPPSGNTLTNGVAVTGLSGALNSEQTWSLAVPAGASNLKFVTSGGSGDMDLYVKFGSAPTTGSYDCRPYATGNAETCTIATAQAGTYHVMLRGFSAYTGVSLTGSFTTGGGGGGTQTYSNTTDYAIGDNTTVDSPITVSGRSGNAPANASVTVAIVHTYQGDLKVDLVAPDGTLYNIHNRSGGSTDNINKTVTLNLSSEALNGTWKLRANDNGPGDTGRIDSWSITF